MMLEITSTYECDGQYSVSRHYVECHEWRIELDPNWQVIVEAVLDCDN